MPPPVPRTARQRARVEITREILDTARGHLARDGAPALSLRAVARDCGMVSSAIYRYVPSRDDLLTMLIVNAYDSIGSAVEAAEAPVPRRSHQARFLTVCHAVRAWAIANPHEYALIFGSPVPGYVAPTDTIGPATRVPVVLMTILVDLHAGGATPAAQPVPRDVAAAISAVRTFTGGTVPNDLLLRGLAAWATLLGSISLELFGHLHDVVDEDPAARAAFFDHQVRRMADGLGLTSAGRH